VLLITPTDRVVLQLMADGHETVEIASRLGMTEREMEAGLRSVCSAIGARSRTEAVALAVRRGLVQADETRSSSCVDKSVSISPPIMSSLGS
jgi:DNA-binding NarL/FixJ family response regulator